MQDFISKAATLLEALPYIQKFSGATFVIKYGGSFMDSPDPEVRNGVARDIVFLEAVEINPVVVHGGGKAITRAMEKAGLKPSFVQGQLVRSIPRLWAPSLPSAAWRKALRAPTYSSAASCGRPVPTARDLISGLSAKSPM
jgi:Amino acid kinase family